MKSLMQKMGFSLFLLMAAVPAWAIDIKEASKNGSGQLNAVAELAIGIFFVIGIILVGAGLLKLKAHKDNPQQTPLSQPLTMLIIGGLMTVILGIMTIAPDSILGNENGNITLQKAPSFK